MSEIEQYQVKQHIERIIDKARPAGEFFFTDTEKAASEILKYLQEQKIIAGNKH